MRRFTTSGRRPIALARLDIRPATSHARQSKEPHLGREFLTPQGGGRGKCRRARENASRHAVTVETEHQCWRDAGKSTDVRRCCNELRGRAGARGRAGKMYGNIASSHTGPVAGGSAGDSKRKRASQPRLFKQHISAGETRGSQWTYSSVAINRAGELGKGRKGGEANGRMAASR